MNAEQKLAAAVVTWLTAGGWEVYQEVTTGCGRADIVAVRGAVRWSIEVKTSLNLAVMDQADNNSAWFHHSSIAVPAPAVHPYGSPRNWQLAHRIAKKLGFGVLRVISTRGGEEYFIVQDVPPRINRRPGPVKLHEAQKTQCQAGSSSGGYYTPFRETVERLVARVGVKPGMTLKDAVSSIPHHYASEPSAVQSLTKMVRQCVIPLRLENGRLYPIPAQ